MKQRSLREQKLADEPFRNLPSRTSNGPQQNKSIMSTVLRFLLLGLALTLTLIANPSPGQAGGDDEGLKLIGAISVPGNPLAVDISFVDQRREKYYIADPSNKAVDVFDAEKDSFLGQIKGNFHGLPTPAEIAFCGVPGFDARGPCGVLVANDDRLWVTDYTGTNGIVKVFELEGDTLPSTPSATITFDGTGNTLAAGCRADELAFDPKDHIVIVGFPETEANGTPFVALISSNPPFNVLGTIQYAGAGGMEQPEWDAKAQRLLVNVPSNPPNFPGVISVVNPKLLNEEKRYVTGCAGTGLALGPLRHLLVGCGDGPDLIMNADTGNILTTFSASDVANSDEVWFNQGDGNFYATSNFTTGSPTLAVVDAESGAFLQGLPTAFGSHSVAAFRENNHVFVPIQNPTVHADVCNSTFGLPKGRGCIFVFANGNEGDDGN
jgi:hypothetical protein